MKGKLLSAMVNGLPVVTTTVGAEGMALQHGETCLLAETAQDFIDALVQLHEDAALWGRLSSQGLSHILDVCGDDVARQTLNSLFGPMSSGS
jgi:O-antigen biosynthesis protein